MGHPVLSCNPFTQQPLVAVLRLRAAPGGRAPRRAAPPEESIPRGGRGGGGGEAPPHWGPHRTRLWQDDAAAIVVAAVAGPLLPADAAKAGAVDVLGLQYSPPLAIAPLLLRKLLLLLQLPWGIGICVGVRRCCCCHCHSGNLVVIVAAFAAIAAAFGGGRTRMIAS
jgi:hypothetical protein